MSVIARRSRRRIGVPRFARTREGQVGLILLGLILAIAITGPLFAPHDPFASIGVPGSPPSGSFLLGTDFLGRDVASRTLSGGVSVIGLAGIATILCYALGITV